MMEAVKGLMITAPVMKELKEKRLETGRQNMRIISEKETKSDFFL